MSIAIGVYDFFSYTIPGILYLYILYELLRLLNLNIIDRFSAVSSAAPPIQIAILIFGLVVAFVAGQVFDRLAHWLVFKLMYRQKTSEVVLKNLKKRDPEANIRFEAKDWHLLLVILRQRNLPVAQTFDKYEADSIMFRNISLISLLMAFLMGAKAVWENPFLWVAVVASLLVWRIAANRSYTLHSWFFEAIFLAALEYGNSVSKVLEHSTRQNHDHFVRFSLFKRGE